MDLYTRFISTIFLLALLAPHGARAQGYEIDIEIKGLSMDTIILGEYFNTRMVPKDTLILDARGKGSFSGEKSFEGGLYLIYINPNAYFDFLLGDDQHLGITARLENLNESLEFEDSEDNRVFQEYKAFLQQKREELNSQQNRLNEKSSANDTVSVQEEMKRINGEMEAYMDRIEKDYANLFACTFIGATREPVPPATLLSGDRIHDDSVRFFYYKDHFLDRFDPFDIRLLHTPIYEGKIKSYLGRAVPQHPDSLIVAVDYLLQGAKSNDEIYRYMLITLFNHFAESKFMGMDAVYFHIAEYYYIPDATWSSEDFISKLQDNLEKNKPTLIGQTAPNIMLREISDDHFQLAAQDTAIKRDPHTGHDFYLNNIQADYTILYFWEADCGHCKKATPALYEIYTGLKEEGIDLKVVSVHVINTLEGKETWVDFVNDHGLYEWINCWSPYSNEFRKLYNLQAFPQLFIFDKDKKIVAKKVSPEQAGQIIRNLVRIESK